MSDSGSRISELVRLWDQHEEPVGHFPRQVESLVGEILSDEESSTSELSLTWHLFEETWSELRWPRPQILGLNRCQTAAASSAQAAAVTTDAVLNAIHGNASNVIVMGQLGCVLSVFDCPDIIPVHGATLIGESDSREVEYSATSLPVENRVVWSGAGRIADHLEEHSSSVQLKDQSIRIPPPEIALISSARSTFKGDSRSSLVFAGAALQCTRKDRWEEAKTVAELTNMKSTVARAARKLGVSLESPFPVGLLSSLLASLRRQAKARPRRASWDHFIVLPSDE